MSLTPFFDAGPPVIFHAVAALAALQIGLLQFFGPKGTTAHRIFGWCRAG